MRDNEERELRDLLNVVPCEVKVSYLLNSNV